MIDIDFWKSCVKPLCSNLPYHNYEHALTVLAYCEELLERCDRYHISVNADALRLAALFHDAGYAEVEHDKESHSAAIAEEELVRQNLSVLVPIVKQAIMATVFCASSYSIEGKILRAADIRSLSGEWETFLKNNQLLREEYLLLGTSFSDDEWIKHTQKVLDHFLSEEILLTPEFEQDNYHGEVRENMRKFLNTHS